MPMKPAVQSLKRVVQCKMDKIYYQSHMLAKLENYDKVRFNALDVLLANKKKVKRAFNKYVTSL